MRGLLMTGSRYCRRHKLRQISITFDCRLFVVWSENKTLILIVGVMMCTLFVGKWFSEEECKLSDAVYQLSGASPGKKWLKINCPSAAVTKLVLKRSVHYLLHISVGPSIC